MTRAECPHFERTEAVSPEKRMRLQVTADIGGQQLPVFGERRGYEPRGPEDTARLTICGICNATDQRVAVESNRYENHCMQAGYMENCSRAKAALRERAEGEV